MASFDTTVLGGLPVEITYTTGRPDPSVGIFNTYVDEWWISAVNGRTSKSYEWVYKRLSEKDEEKIIEECYENQNY